MFSSSHFHFTGSSNSITTNNPLFAWIIFDYMIIMGFKQFFNGKKKLSDGGLPLTSSFEASLHSRSSSQTSRARIEEELEQVFKKFDVNGDGKISADELGSIMGSLGSPAMEEELSIMIREVDSDGDGFINLQEFVELNTKDVNYNEVLDNLRDAFHVFDIDKNGSISAEELKDVLMSLGEECTLAECRKMISGVDSDGNGTVSFDEFKVMMTMGLRFDAAIEPKID